MVSETHSFSRVLLNPAFHWLGRQSYMRLLAHMQRQVELIRRGDAAEVVWSCEHDPVYTTGRRGIDNRRQAELPAPLVQSDRGGETTFHGPGQLMLYPLLSLRGRRIGVRDYVCLLEQSCIDVLADLGVTAEQRNELPGVWVADAKIAAIGLRVSRGMVWHGMALNVAVSRHWFAAINPCGTGLGVICLRDVMQPPSLAELAARWYVLLCERLEGLGSR